MQTWAKRGVNAALLTGGLFMLGTGIASATETVNPDAQPIGIDGLLTASRSDAPNTAVIDVPIDAQNNAVKSPLGNIEVPAAIARVQVLPGMPAKVDGLTQQLIGTKTVASIGAPAQIVNNQAGILTDVEASGDYTQTYDNSNPVTANGDGQTLQGNVIRVNDLVPMQLANNAVAVGSNAATSGTADQAATGGGDITTSGTGGKLSGNVVDQRWAVPLGLGGTALALGGESTSASNTSQTVHDDAKDITDGAGGFLSGNVANNPAALPVVLNSNAGSVLGHATSANPDNASIDGNCGAITAPNQSNTVATANGDTIALATDSVGSGNIINPQTALATGAYAVAATFLGTADAAHTGDTTAQADGSTYSNGSGGSLSGNTIANPVAGVPEVACLTAGVFGSAGAGCDETRTATAGGYNGTLGNDSFGSGNLVQTPFAAPAEVLGNAIGFGGDATSVVSEDKTVTAGGTPNSQDDFGKISSNVFQFANALPVVVDGIGVPIGGKTDTCTTVVTNTQAGQAPKATGKKGILSGNIGAQAASVPVEIEEMVLGGLGEGVSNVDSVVDSQAGGPATTTGEDGIGAGNIAAVPLAGAIQNSGINTVVLGDAEGTLFQDTTSVAGGDNTTNGDNGKLSGIIADLPLMPKFASIGHAFTAGGDAVADADAVTTLTAGGDDTTSGVDGIVAGDIAQVPVAGAIDWFACVMGIVGDADSDASVVSPVQAGGDLTTDGTGGTLSGDALNPGVKVLTGLASDALTVVDGTAVANGVNGFDGAPSGTVTTAGTGGLSGLAMFEPLVLNGQLKQFVLQLGGHASATNVDAPGRWQDGFDLPFDFGVVNGLMGATALPSLPIAARGARQDLPSLPVTLPQPSLQLPDVGSLFGTLPTAELPMFDRLYS